MRLMSAAHEVRDDASDGAQIGVMVARLRTEILL